MSIPGLPHFEYYESISRINYQGIDTERRSSCILVFLSDTGVNCGHKNVPFIELVEVAVDREMPWIHH